MRPALKPALSRAWRDPRTLQFGTVRSHARVVDEVDRPVADFLQLLDGTRDHPALLAAGQRLGLDPEVVAQLLDALEQAGLLDDAEATELALAGYSPARQPLLAPDIASLSLLHPVPAEAPAVLAARCRAAVEVRGAGRIGAALASVLAASGVGSVNLVDRGRVTARDCAPAGFPPADIGRLRATAGRELVSRTVGGSAEERHKRPAPGPPALVVLAPRGGGGAFGGAVAEALQLMRSGTPHLYVGVVEHLGIVGPLVIPGGTACGRCATLARRDEDEAWPRLFAQLADDGPGRARSPACDTALATAVAGLAALHIGLYLAGDRPPSMDGWYELSAGDGMARRLRLRDHPDCGCLWQSAPAPPPRPAEPARCTEQITALSAGCLPAR